MRPSESLTLDALAAHNTERSEARTLIELSIAHEEQCIRAFNERESEELRSIKVEMADRESRMRQMFDQLRAGAQKKIDLCNEQLVQVEGRIPNPVDDMVRHGDGNVTELMRSAG